MAKNQQSKKNPCWKGYEQIGTKNKKGKKVPNCVPKKSENEESITESLMINKFIECIVDKKYTSANKYLKSIVEDKIQKRIEKAINTPLFR
jgi:hypothetical protein